MLLIDTASAELAAQQTRGNHPIALQHAHKRRDTMLTTPDPQTHLGFSTSTLMACLLRHTTGALCPRRVVHRPAPSCVLDIVEMYCETPRTERRRSVSD